MEKKQRKTVSKKNGMTEMSEETQSRLRSFFTDQLKDIYWAEKHLVKTLPKMQKASTNEELANAFAGHLEQTKTHVTRIEEAFSLLGEKIQAKKCEAMEGLIKEGEDIMDHTEEGTSTRDVGLILAAQKVEHYEIATYGSLVQLARTLELEEIADLLQTTLLEEKQTDHDLTEIAESKINHMSLEEMEA